jgi:hypothetical protein
MNDQLFLVGSGLYFIANSLCIYFLIRAQQAQSKQLDCLFKMIEILRKNVDSRRERP